MKIEKRPYHQDNTSQAEIALILDRVYIHQPHILVVQELPVTSEFSFQLISNKIHQLHQEMGYFCLISDLRELISRPPFKIRRAIYQEINQMDNLIFAAAIIEMNPLMKSTFKFFTPFVTKKKGIYTTFEEALEASQIALKNHLQTQQ